MYTYNATIIKVIDGDTIKVLVDLGFKIFVEKTLRLARINAPETSTPEGLISKTWLTEKLPKDSKITFTSKSLDNYGRSIAEVFIDTVKLSDLIIENKMAAYKKY